MKSVQTKVIFILFLIGIILIMGSSAFEIYLLSKAGLDTYVLNKQIENVILISIGIIAIYGASCIVVEFCMLRFVVAPMSRMLKSAKKAVVGQQIDEKQLKPKKVATQQDELTKSVNEIVEELNQSLTEADRQRKQTETILKHMNDGVISFDMKGNVTYINPAAVDLLELKEKDNTFEQIFHKFSKDINMEKIIYLENWTSSEKRLETSKRFLNLLFAPFKDEIDRPSGVMVVVQDITEHVKLDNMRKEFVADVSHELKTPITSIRGYADTLLDGEYDKKTQDKFLEVISSEGERMGRLVNDLLTLSKYDSQKVNIEKTTFDLGELAKQCKEKLNIEISKKNQKVLCLETADVPPVYADKYGIERVILNILSNSIKYTPENGEINIYVGFVYNDAYIKIKDNGIGIPKDDLKRIFERFYRVDKARSRQLGGTGLGLSIAKEIIDQNDGSIDIKSEVGKGTEVIIRVPTKKNEEKANS